MFRNPFGRVRSSCSVRHFWPENWTERHELSRASFSNRWHCGQNCGQSQMRSAHKQKNPTISNVKSFYFLSECNYRIWKKPVISMVLGQQARGFYPKNQFPYPFLLIWFCMPEYLLFSPNEVCYQEAIWYL